MGTAENPDSLCPIGDMCVDCQCKTPLPPGCNCNPEASPEDSTCSASETCVGCRCLQQGCDCDPTSDNPDSLCPAGDKCVDCKCKSPLPPTRSVPRGSFALAASAKPALNPHKVDLVKH